MDQTYWDQLASTYDQQVFSSLRSDRAAIITKRLNRYADATADACDFGCGVGQYLPELSRRFARVDAIDLSPKLVSVAKKATAHLDNVRYFQGSLTDKKLPVRRTHFGVCANVLIMPSLETRAAILNTLHRYLKPGGRILFVIPSAESALFVNQRLVQWNQRMGFTEKEAIDASIRPSRAAAADILNGVFDNGSEPTKHYLREEFTALLHDSKFKTLSADKIQYGWHTEFDDPPTWLDESNLYPWDWLFVAQRP